MVGRTIRPEEDQVADTHAVAVISHRLWQRLGGSDEALKSGLIVNGRLFSIIGVMPSTFVGTEPLVPDLWVPLSMQARVDLSPDWRVFGGTSVLCGLVAVLVGLVPALQARRVQVIEALHGAVSMFGARVSQSRARAILVNAQVAISVALIIAAGLLSRAALRAEGLDVGFSPRNVLTTDYDLKRYQFPPSRSVAARARHCLRRE
jgi:hypothetical protein